MEADQEEDKNMQGDGGQ